MEEINHRAADGCVLLATVMGEGRALVLLHAGGPDHKSMLPLAERLADRGMVILPDVPGPGGSGRVDRGRGHQLAMVPIGSALHTADDLARATAPTIRAFLRSTVWADRPDYRPGEPSRS